MRSVLIFSEIDSFKEMGFSIPDTRSFNSHEFSDIRLRPIIYQRQGHTGPFQLVQPSPPGLSVKGQGTLCGVLFSNVICHTFL